MNNSNKQVSLTTRIFITTIVVMTLTCLTSTFTGLFDGFMVSKFVGTNGTASRSLANTIDKLFIGLAQLIALGSQIVITKYISKGEREKANKVFNTMFLICLIGSVVFMIVGLSASKYIAQALAAGKKSEEALINTTSQYLFGYFIGVPFIFLNQLMLPIIFLDGGKRLTKISLVSVIIVNCSLVSVFVIFMQQKMLWVGIASSISAFATFVIYLFHFLRGKSSFKFNFKKLKFDDTKDVLVNGSTMGLKYICVTLKLYLFGIIILTVGNIYMPGEASIVLAARGAQETISGLFETSCGGILLTTVMMGSVFYSEENKYELKKLFKNMLKFIFAICYVVAIVYFFCARPIAVSYLPKNVSSKELELCIYGMRCGAITILFLPFNSMFLGYLQSTRKVKYAYITTALQSFILPVGCMAGFGFAFGVYGLFIGYMVSTMLYIPIYLIICIIKNKKFPRNLTQLFFLDKNFGTPDNLTINENIRSKKDLDDLINKINILLEKNNIKNKNVIIYTKKLLNIILNNYYTTKNKNKLCISFVISIKKNKVIINSRDNYYKFNFIDSKNIQNKEIIDFLSCLKKDKKVNINYTYVLKTNGYVINLNN